MHNTKLYDNWSVNHDGIPSDDSIVEFVYTSLHKKGSDKIQIPYGIIKAFVAEQIRNKRIRDLEDMDYDNLLK